MNIPTSEVNEKRMAFAFAYWDLTAVVLNSVAGIFEVHKVKHAMHDAVENIVKMNSTKNCFA